MPYKTRSSGSQTRPKPTWCVRRRVRYDPSARSRVTATPDDQKQKTAPPAISDAATQYAQEVVAGKRVAGPHVRAQCARHLKDIAEGGKRGLVWNVEESERRRAFMPMC